MMHNDDNEMAQYLSMGRMRPHGKVFMAHFRLYSEHVFFQNLYLSIEAGRRIYIWVSEHNCSLYWLWEM